MLVFQHRTNAGWYWKDIAVPLVNYAQVDKFGVQTRYLRGDTVSPQLRGNR